MNATNYMSVHPPITEDTDEITKRAIKAVGDAARAALQTIEKAKGRPQLDGPRVPKQSMRKKARVRARASRKANR